MPIDLVVERLPVVYAHFDKEGRLVRTRTSPTRSAHTRLTIVEYIPRAQSNERDETQDMWVFEDGGDCLGVVEYDGQDKDPEDEGERYVRFSDLQDALSRAQANEARRVTCGECRFWRPKASLSLYQCDHENGLKRPLNDGSDFCRYAEPRKAREDGK